MSTSQVCIVPFVSCPPSTSSPTDLTQASLSYHCSQDTPFPLSCLCKPWPYSWMLFHLFYKRAAYLSCRAHTKWPSSTLPPHWVVHCFVFLEACCWLLVCLLLCGCHKKMLQPKRHETIHWFSHNFGAQKPQIRIPGSHSFRRLQKSTIAFFCWQKADLPGSEAEWL